MLHLRNTYLFPTVQVFLLTCESSVTIKCDPDISQKETTPNTISCILLPAEDLGYRKNLSITVPHWHSRSFAAAQTTGEGVVRFLFHFWPSIPLRQLLLRSVPADCLVALLFLIWPTTHTSNLFMSFLLFARGGTETDGLHAVDLHKWQVKLRPEKWRLGQTVFKRAGPALFRRTCPHLVLGVGVPVEELQESQWLSVPHQDEVSCSICQVGRGREALRTPETRAGHTSESHTPEPALHCHPFTWREEGKKRASVVQVSECTIHWFDCCDCQERKLYFVLRKGRIVKQRLPIGVGTAWMSSEINHRCLEMIDGKVGTAQKKTPTICHHLITSFLSYLLSSGWCHLLKSK